MTSTDQTLINHIETAFAGVVLGHGVSIREACEIDNRGGSRRRIAARARDIEQSWRDVTVEVLNKYHQYIVFLDREGLRFYLPAFMHHYIQSESWSGSEDLILALCIDDRPGRFDLLTFPQAASVYEFLSYARSNDNYNADEIEQGCAKYWSRFSNGGVQPDAPKDAPQAARP